MAEQSKSDGPLERLARIRPMALRPRFLISWDPQTTKLWYGLGSGKDAVRVSSEKKLENWAGAEELGARLEVRTVRLFMDSSEPVIGPALLHELTTRLNSFVHFEDERIYLLLATWTIATYLYPIFGHFGYLFFHSKLPRSGKTRSEETLSHLVFEGCAPITSPTVPAIRDTSAEGRTLILDTVERWKGKSPEAFYAAMELLDAGFRNGSMVTKMEQVANGKWRRHAIPVFAPYILAGISRDSLSDTALDRSFVIEMRRKKVATRKRRYDYHQSERECQSLRQRLYLFALQNAAAVARAYSSAELEAEMDAMQLHDRAADIWRPLFAVLLAMGVEACFYDLKQLAREMAMDPEIAEDLRKLKIITTLKQRVNGTEVLILTSTQVEQYLAEAGIKVNALHSLLSTWGFTQQNARLDKPWPERAWQIEDSRLGELENQLRAGISPAKK